MVILFITYNSYTLITKVLLMCNKIKSKWGSPRNVVTIVLNYDLEVSKFEMQSRHYVHFRTNTLGKGMNPLILGI